MLRSRQEKEQLVRKFEEFAPFLKEVKNFGWIVPECDADPVYRIYPDTSEGVSKFKPFTVNLKTGWHSEIVRRDGTDLVRIPEATSDVDTSDWSDYCYRSCCTQPARIV